MSHIADRFVVLLDANVLYPFWKRDSLLRFSHAGLYRARWTTAIVDEWTRALLAKKPELEASIRSQQRAMIEEFPEALVDGYEALIGALKLPDPDDHHVLAAAVCCGAQHIITENLSDFPEAGLSHFGIEAIDADEFLSRTFDLYPGEATAVMRAQRAAYNNPAYSPSEFLMELTAKGMPKLAARLRDNRNLI